MFNLIVQHKHFIRQIAFVPAYKPPDQRDFQKLRDFLIKNDKVLILTGAGISTESVSYTIETAGTSFYVYLNNCARKLFADSREKGIPDYRSEEVGLYARSNHKPIQYQEFVKYPKVRQRYWARNFVGWPRFSSVQPNTTHYAIRQLEKIGKVTSVVTQNVDRLHHKAGSHNVIELHGTGYIVKCMHCPYEIDRFQLQEILLNNNPSMQGSFNMIRPDGDVELSKDQVERFQTPLCPVCEGPLKPDIIFFGDNVPKERVENVRNQVSGSDAVFVLGSSLTVYSSYRIILQAKEENKEVAVLNIGPTRADNIVDLKISTKCGEILTDLTNSLCT